MDEIKTNEEGMKEELAKTEDAGSKYETTPVIERARQENEKMEAVVKELRSENDRRERIMAKRALGGESEAGGESQKISKEDKKKKDAAEFFKGTQLEKDINAQ